MTMTNERRAVLLVADIADNVDKRTVHRHYPHASDEHGNVNDILFDAFLNETWEDENGQQPANLADMWNNNWATAEIITTTAA